MNEYVNLLDRLIATPSISRQEQQAAALIEAFLTEKGISDVQRLHNNIYVRAKTWDNDRPTLLLNSHIDTVKPAASYTRDPFKPQHEQ